MDKFQELLSQKMDRKQFLITLGVIVLALTGVTAALRNLKELEIFSGKQKKVAGKGFGAGPYGV